ncbi:triose-phosphate isomerase [Candidatus Parcubacteria bacterium]|nr:triose-phosphate isomerase [Candidatus Parcubacteria bacterium]
MKKIIIANWKMYLSTREAVLLAGKYNDLKSPHSVILAPSFTALSGVEKTIRGNGLKLCAQNIFWAEYGAYTGEIAGLDIKQIGCEYVILGHSERRKYAKEDYETINKKIKVAIKAKLTPVLCIGENLRERRSGHAWKVLESQLKTGLKAIDKKNIIIAYEPIWAIGTGNAEDPVDADKMHAHIKKYVGKSTPVLYGGSVNNKNFNAFLTQKNIDGLLVGGASTRYEEFKEIIT